jgi:glycosyltransferase involved in cell wall biosynthesis
MKILMCNKFHFIFGGTERYLFDLCDGLGGLGHSVIHFSTREARNFDSLWSDYFIEQVAYDELSKKDLFSNIKNACNFIYSFKAKRKIGSLIDQYQPQIAHIHNIYHQISPSILHVLKKKRIPVIMTLHDYKLICPSYNLFSKGSICEKCKGARYYHAFFNRCLKESVAASLLGCLEMYFHKLLNIYSNNVDLFIVPSRFVYNKMIEFGVNPKKVMFIPYAINIDKFKPNFEPGSYILYSGRLIVEKGVITLLKSLKLFPDLPVKILGEGPQRSELEKFMHEEGIKNVEFLGYKNKDELSLIIRNSLCVVVPSEWYEPAGLVVYEAFAAGKCVIASRVGGIPELVEDGVNGLLFEPANFYDLADKIRYIIEHPQKAKEWGKNGFEKIHRFNDPIRHCQIITDLYSRVINSC